MGFSILKKRSVVFLKFVQSIVFLKLINFYQVDAGIQ